MLITVLNSKYKVGCERGMSAEERPDLLFKLNGIIEWDLCEFPKKQDGTEDREFLGKTPELKPGNCFAYEGNVFAIDREDRIVLVVSETGPKAVFRFADMVELENNLLLNRVDVDSIEMREVDPVYVPDNYEERGVSFYLMKLFREKYLYGRHPGEGLCLECDVQYIFPMKIYIKDWKMCVNPEDIDEDMIKRFHEEVIAWFYKKFKRNLPPKPELPELPKSEN